MREPLNFGYAGRLLEVDLEQGKVETVPFDRELAASYLGGKGLGARILYDRLACGTDPLSPGNVLVFATGPLTGTPAPTSSRVLVCTKSPLTGLWLDSNAGGFFGPVLKRAGYDGVILTGASSKPVILIIDGKGVRLEDASELWGLDTFETHRRLKERLGRTYRVAAIGPAGEQQVPLAAIITEGRAFGRGGAGAVMGAKNLKAVVVAGQGKVEVHNPDAFRRSLREAQNEISIHPDSGGGRPKYGSNVIYSFIKEAGVLPIKNFQGGTYPGMDEVSEHVLAEKYYREDRACFACPIKCGKLAVVAGGKYDGSWVEGPEYEDMWSFGAQCGNSDIGAIIQAEYLCDYYGLDAISVGNTIGFSMECYERGILTEEELGFAAPFGDDDAIIKLVHLIGKKEGIGELLGCGVRHAAEQLGQGSQDFAMHVKGLEIPAYDPRAAFGMGLAYATSDRGACHLRAWSVGAEVLDGSNRMDPFSTEFKAEYVKNQQDWFAVIDSLGLCLFGTFPLSPRQVTDLVYHLTGLETFSEAEKLLQAGERIYNLTRLFNLREGATGKDDTLPRRLLDETLTTGPARGQKLDLQTMLQEYYFIRGWDTEGRPKREKLVALGLGEVAGEG